MKEVSTTMGQPEFEAACEMRLQLGEWRGSASRFAAVNVLEARDWPVLRCQRLAGFG